MTESFLSRIFDDRNDVDVPKGCVVDVAIGVDAVVVGVARRNVIVFSPMFWCQILLPKVYSK